MPGAQPINNNPSPLTCPAIGTPNYTNYFNEIENFFQRINPNLSLNQINSNITDLEKMLSYYVCALYARPNLIGDIAFKNHANAAILRLAQAYFMKGKKLEDDGQDAAARTAFQTAKSIIDAFLAHNGSSTFTPVPGEPPSASLSAILQLARALPETYARGITQGEFAGLKAEINAALGNTAELVSLAEHFFTNHLTYNPNDFPPFHCSCGNASHVYYYDMAVNARAAWAEVKAKTAPHEVIGKIAELVQMLNLMIHPTDGRPVPQNASQIYTRVISAIARAYAIAGKAHFDAKENAAAVSDCRNANDIFLALLGGALPPSLIVNGVSLNPTPVETAKLRKEYYWNQVNWGGAESNASRLIIVAQEIRASHLGDEEYRKILGGALGQLWMTQLDSYAKSKTNIPDERRVYLDLILQYLSEENITFTLPTTNSTELLKGAIWALIDCEKEYDHALTLAVRHRFTDIAIVALEKKIEAMGKDNISTLPYHLALSALLKRVLDGIPITGDFANIWQFFREVSSSQANVNPLDFPAAAGTIQVTRIQLYFEIKAAAKLMEKAASAPNPPAAVPAVLQLMAQYQVSLNDILALAQAENSQIEEEYILAIRNSANPSLDNFLNLAQAYTEMANYAEDSGNDAFARICLLRAETLYRGIILVSGDHPPLLPLDMDADYLSAQQFPEEQLALQDIRDLIQKLASRHYTLKTEEQIKVYLEFADATRRAELSSELDPAAGQLIMDGVLRYYEKVKALCGTNADYSKYKLRAENGIRDAQRTWTEILIRNGRAEEAIQKLQGYINGLTPAAEGEARTEDLKFYLLCLIDLAWAYEKWAEQLMLSPGNRERIAQLYLQSAALYRFLARGDIPADADPALTSILVRINATDSLRADLTTEAMLSEANTSPAKIYLKYLDYLRLAGTQGPLNSTACEDLLNQVITELTDPQSLARDNVMLSRALTALHQRQVARGAIADAEKSIQDAVAAGEAAYAAEKNEDSFSALTWALGVRGGFLDAQGKLAEAHADFTRAIELYQAEIALYDLPKLHFDLASLLKAASKGAETTAEMGSLLNQALAEYQKVEGPAAQAGQAEVNILLGELLEGSRQNTEAEAKYREALRLCLTVLSSNPSLENIRSSAAVLQNILILSRAADNLYQLLDLENFGGLELALFRELLGLPQGTLPQVPGSDISQIIHSIRAARSRLMDPDVLAEAQQSIWNIRYQYLEALRATHNYSSALSAAQDYLSQIPASPSLEEIRFKLKVLKLIADISCYNLQPSNLELARANYEQVITLANDFGTQDPEIASLARNAHQGLGYIHQANGDFEQAIIELKTALSLVGENMTPEGAVAAAQIYLALAQIYTNDIKDAHLAQENLIDAQAMLLVPGVNQNEVLDLRAQTYYALGEIARLIDENYPVAASQYQAALTLLEGSKEQNTIAQIHAALAFLRIAEQNYQEAESEVALAQANLEDATEGVIDMVDSAVTALRRGELDNTAYVQFGFAFQSNSFEGNDPQNNWPLNLHLGVPVWQNLKLDLGYSYGPGHSTTYYDSASLEELPRMSSAGHHLDFGATYEDEFGNFIFKVNPYFAFDIYDYTVNGYTHPADYSTITDSYTESGNYFAATQGFNSELFYKLLPELQIGLGFGLSVTERSGTLPSQAAELQTAEEFPDVEKPELENDPFPSWYLHPQLRWNGISLGFRAGDSAYDVSEQAFWPLGNRDTMRYAATLGYNNLFTFGDDDRWFLNLGLGSEVGTHLYLTGSEGIGYVVSDDFIPQLIFTQSYFNDFSLDTSSYNLGLGLRINFDLTPGSDD